MQDKQTALSDEVPPWHNYSPQQALETLKTAHTGLSQAEAELRLEQYGANRLQPPKPKSIVIRFLLQFHNVLIYILLAAWMMTVFLGYWVDGGVILGVVVINAMIVLFRKAKLKKQLMLFGTCCHLTLLFCAKGNGYRFRLNN